MAQGTVLTREQPIGLPQQIGRLIPGVVLLFVLGYLGKLVQVSIKSYGVSHHLALPDIEYVLWAIIFGLIIAARVGVIHITLTYLASFLILNTLRATAFGQPVLPEIAPVTGPMYQLFLFFMITDPRTIVRGRRRQIIVAVIIAVMEMLIRLASDLGWPLPTAFNVAPAFFALALVGPVAKWLDLRRQPQR